MPQGHRHKDHVTMATFTSAGKAQQIIKWVNSQLANKVQTKHRRIEDADSGWDRIDHGEVTIKIVLLSRDEEPPMFFSALNLKYSGRVKFVFVSIQDDSDTIQENDLSSIYSMPSYVVITPEGKKIYGKKSGEYCTFKALDIYLQTLTPEANDIFVLTFINVNAICFIGFFIIQGGIAKRISTCLLTIGKYNITFLLLWLPLLGIIQLPCLAPVVDYSYKIIRMVSETWLMGKLRQDWLMYSGHSYLLIGCFLLYCIAVNWISKKLHTPTYEDRMTSAMWLRASMVDFFNFMLRPSPHFQNGPPRSDHLEEGLDMLIEQMAVPDFWLHPTIPTDYIKGLLIWRYSCEWLQQRSSSNDNDSSDSERASSVCRYHRKKCSELRKYVLNCKMDCPCACNNPELGTSCERMKRNDFVRVRDDGDHLFVVKSHEKVVCHQPEPLSQSDSENMKTILSDKHTEVGRSEAQLDSIEDLSQKHKAKTDVASEQCSRCIHEEQGPSFINREMEPETLVAQSTSFKDEAVEALAHNVRASRRSSPKHSMKVTSPVTSPKTSPRKKPKVPDTDAWPEGVLFNAQCSICLESYAHGVTLCGLPCSHAYHQQCIVAWLTSGDHVCPICRWPAYKKKGCKLSKHME